MPRPTSKQELLSAIEKERPALEKFLETLTPEQMTVTGIVGEWTVKDVLCHLIAWEQMCLSWYRKGLDGEMPAVPAPGFKWNETPQLNQKIYEEHRDWPLEKVLNRFQESHAEILGVIRSLPNETLFTPGKFAWTNKNTLGTYLVSATSSHYLWARNECRKGFKRLLAQT